MGCNCSRHQHKQKKLEGFLLRTTETIPKLLREPAKWACCLSQAGFLLAKYHNWIIHLFIIRELSASGFSSPRSQKWWKIEKKKLSEKLNAKHHGQPQPKPVFGTRGSLIAFVPWETNTDNPNITQCYPQSLSQPLWCLWVSFWATKGAQEATTIWTPWTQGCCDFLFRSNILVYLLVRDPLQGFCMLLHKIIINKLHL